MLTYWWVALLAPAVVSGAVVLLTIMSLARRSREKGYSCPRCGYPAEGLGEPRCPECGTDFLRRGVRVATAPRRFGPLLTIPLTLAIAAATTWVVLKCFDDWSVRLRGPQLVVSLGPATMTDPEDAAVMLQHFGVAKPDLTVWDERVTSAFLKSRRWYTGRPGGMTGDPRGGAAALDRLDQHVRRNFERFAATWPSEPRAMRGELDGVSLEPFEMAFVEASHYTSIGPANPNRGILPRWTLGLMLGVGGAGAFLVAATGWLAWKFTRRWGVVPFPDDGLTPR